MKQGLIKYFNRASIPKKIVLSAVLNISLVLALLSTSYFLLNWSQYKQHQVSRLETIASIMASTSEAALLFNDRNAGAEYIYRLRGEKDLEQAIIYDASGEIFAHLYTPQLNQNIDPEVETDTATWTDYGLVYTKTIRSNGRDIGTIYLQTNRSALNTFFIQSLCAVCLLFVVGVTFTLLLIPRFTRSVTEPILGLAKLAKEVTATNDYTKTAAKVHDDEIGSLVESFNTMLRQIEAHDKELKESHAQLEQQVLARTSELEQLNQSLRITTEKAQAASKAKSDFLSVMSHELRTPMNAIIGMASLLAEDEHDEENAETIQIIQKSSQTLLNLVDDILDYSKIEAGQIDIEHTPFDLYAALVNPMSIVAAQNENTQLILYADCSPDLPQTVVGDPTRISQIITNLLSNALKFTESGSVSLRAKLIQRQSGPFLQVEVKDTGIGIPEDRLDRLFQHFSQVDTSTTRRYGGTGLGLAISQRLARAMHGEITVQSEINIGTTFCLELPLTEAAESKRIFSEYAVSEHQSIALFGFDGAIKQSVGNMALNIGLSVQTDAAKWNSNRVTPLILGQNFDPEMLKETFRISFPEHKISDCIVLCLPSQSAGFRNQLGCRTLSLPLTPDALSRQFKKSAVSSHESEWSTSKNSSEILHILLAEDNAINQRVFVRMMQRTNHHLEIVKDGTEAVEEVRQRIYDIVFMDYMMPQLNGLEATQQIRAMENIVQPYIVALTADAESETAKLLLSAGSDEYLAKPISKEDIYDLLQRFIANK